MRIIKKRGGDIPPLFLLTVSVKIINKPSIS
jgi:hypothetical protein